MFLFENITINKNNNKNVPKGPLEGLIIIFLFLCLFIYLLVVCCYLSLCRPACLSLTISKSQQLLVKTSPVQSCVFLSVFPYECMDYYSFLSWSYRKTCRWVQCDTLNWPYSRHGVTEKLLFSYSALWLTASIKTWSVKLVWTKNKHFFMFWFWTYQLNTKHISVCK